MRITWHRTAFRPMPWWWKPWRRVKPAVKRCWWLARGRYPAGIFYVDARRWWSWHERKSAKLAARVIAYRQNDIQAEMRRQVERQLIFGEPVAGVRMAGETLTEEKFFEAMDAIYRNPWERR